MSGLQSNKRSVSVAAHANVQPSAGRAASRTRREHLFVGADVQEASAGIGESTHFSQSPVSGRCLPTSSPTVEMIKSERRLAGLSQPAAARLVGLGHGSRWAEFESGARPIDGARWELFLLKIGRHPHRVLTPRRDDAVS